MVYLYIIPKTSKDAENQYLINNNELSIGIKGVNPYVRRYLFRNVNCLGFDCFNPKDVRTYPESEKNNLLTTTSYRNFLHRKCLTMHEDGCPEICSFKKSTFDRRIQEGWRWIVI